MGRHAKELTEEQITQVSALAAFLTQEQIADYFGVCRVTFNEMMKRNPEISVQYKKGKARAIGSIAGNLIRQAQEGNITAGIFYLKTQAGWKEKSEVEHSGMVLIIDDIPKDNES